MNEPRTKIEKVFQKAGDRKPLGYVFCVWNAKRGEWRVYLKVFATPEEAEKKGRKALASSQRKGSTK